MTPQQAVLATDEELAQHLRTLDEQRLIPFLAEVDALEQQRRERPADLAASAQFYAEHGWPVFPLIENGKRPLTRNGFLAATTDPDKIRFWWGHRPEANIGTPTGYRSEGGCGFDVIDVDGPDGFLSIAAMQHADCPPDCCAETICNARGALSEVVGRSTTPGNATAERPRPPGAHYWIPATGTSCTTRALPGIDLRGTGGYVVLPPSLGPDGGRYFWTARPDMVLAR